MFLVEASKARRFLNWLIDSVGVLLLLAVLVRLLAGPEASAWQLRILSLAALFSYYVLGEFYFQRTLGKLLTRTTVVDQDDEAPQLLLVVLRTACRFLPLEPLSMLLSKQNRAWHDKLSDTKVVYINY